MKKIKILMLLPLYGQVPCDSVMSLINLIYDAKDYYDINFIAQLDMYTPLSRCNLFSKAVKFIKDGNDLDAIFYLDQDHKYGTNDFMNLLSKFIVNDYDVLGAMYRYKDQTQRPVAYKFDPFECLEDLKPNSGIVDVDAIGLGFCFMKPEFVIKIFEEYGQWPFMTLIDENNKFIGEDIAFFKRAKKINAKIGLDTDIYIHHVGAAI